MALSEKIKEIIGALTDSLNPMGEGEYEDDFEGGFDATTIAAIRPFVKINGQALNDLTFLQNYV